MCASNIGTRSQALSGTSMATGMVSGLAAYYLSLDSNLQRPGTGLTSRFVQSRLKSTSWVRGPTAGFMKAVWNGLSSPVCPAPPVAVGARMEKRDGIDEDFCPASLNPALTPSLTPSSLSSTQSSTISSTTSSTLSSTVSLTPLSRHLSTTLSTIASTPSSMPTSRLSSTQSSTPTSTTLSEPLISLTPLSTPEPYCHNKEWYNTHETCLEMCFDGTCSLVRTKSRIRCVGCYPGLIVHYVCKCAPPSHPLIVTTRP